MNLVKLITKLLLCWGAPPPVELDGSAWVHSKSEKPPKRSEHQFKLQFYIFEKSQGEHNDLDCQILFGKRLHYWLLQLLLNHTLLRWWVCIDRSLEWHIQLQKIWLSQCSYSLILDQRILGSRTRSSSCKAVVVFVVTLIQLILKLFSFFLHWRIYDTREFVDTRQPRTWSLLVHFVFLLVRSIEYCCCRYQSTLNLTSFASFLVRSIRYCCGMQNKIPMSRSIEAGARRKTGGFAALQSMADQPNLGISVSLSPFSASNLRFCALFLCGVSMTFLSSFFSFCGTSSSSSAQSTFEWL